VIKDAYLLACQREDELLRKYLKKNIDIMAANGMNKPY